MKPIAILGAGLVALASGSYGGGYHAPPAPRAPQAPRPPKVSEPFKPFHGTHIDSNRGGVDAFPHAKKPKGYVGPF